MKDSEGAKVVEVDTEGSTELPHQVAVHHCFHKFYCTFKQIMILAARWKRAPTGHLFLVESESGCDASTKKFPKYTYILLVFKMKK